MPYTASASCCAYQGCSYAGGLSSDFLVFLMFEVPLITCQATTCGPANNVKKG